MCFIVLFFFFCESLKPRELRTSSTCMVIRVWLNLEKPDELLLVLVGLIEYSEGTLCVLMLCLKGLFNSANRHKKACVSHAAEAAVHCWHSLWWGVCSSSRPLWVNLGSISRIVPDRRMNSGFYVCIWHRTAVGLCWCTFELAMKNN